MAPRPKNPPPDRRKEILEAALRLFGEQGYSATTNAQIARGAGVTSAALYYYFPSKEALFLAAVTERQEELAPVLADLGSQVLDMPPQVVLPFGIQQVIRFMRAERTQSVFRVLIAEGPLNPGLVRIWEEQIVGPVASLLLGYLHRQMEVGNLRSMDPRIVVMLLLGPIIMATLTRDVMGVQLVQGLSDEELTQEMIEKLIPGLLTPTPPRTGSDRACSSG